MSGATPSVIYIDARAIQDPDYRFRGVGQHSASLIEALRRHDWSRRRPRLVAVTDVAAEPLQPAHRRLFDSVTTQPRPEPRGTKTAAEGPEWFLSLSPMTHDPVWAAAFLEDKTFYRVGLFYDLIPLKFPERYLSSAVTRMSYVVSLAWLRRYDAFAAISQFSADELCARVAIAPEKVFVSGVAVRRTLQPPEGEAPLTREDRKLIVVSGGGDPRKNPECALIAHAESRLLRRSGLRLAVFGNYPESMRAELRALYAKHGGSAEDLTFLVHLPDEELRQVYRQGLATIVPSQAEGFSIPIVESSAAGTPVLASNVGAHPELACDPAWRFDPSDWKQLRALIERLLSDEAAWSALQLGQASLWNAYTLDQVGSRFVEGLIGRAPERVSAPAVKRKARPSIAILSPLPPAPSGVADYTAATLRPLKSVADLHMFTPTPNAIWEPGWASLSSVANAGFSPRRFDATVSVMGNSDHHIAIHDFLLQHGGACIAHDARQIDFYLAKDGLEATTELARKELGRDVKETDVWEWAIHQHKIQTLFLSKIARASNPLFLHSIKTAEIVRELYGVNPAVLPFAQYNPFDLDSATAKYRSEVRHELGFEDDELVLVSFGIVAPDKAPDELVWVLRFLKQWGIRARLVLCGSCSQANKNDLVKLATELDVLSSLITYSIPVSVATYRAHLAAADIGIQLRTYFMGALSGALIDCVTAALPTISNAHLADSMSAPEFVRRVPDGPSAMLIAEAVLEIVGSHDNINRPLQAAKAFAYQHSPESYSKQLLKGLGFESLDGAL
jgi:glycosyltransferase involved in cell wall biosynthesis